jgi:hypothetical protein
MTVFANYFYRRFPPAATMENYSSVFIQARSTSATVQAWAMQPRGQGDSRELCNGIVVDPKAKKLNGRYI